MKHWIALAILLLIGLGGLLLIDNEYRAQVRRENDRDLAQASKDEQQQLRIAVAARLRVVEGLRAFMLAPASLPEDEIFDRFAANVLVHYPAISALMYADQHRIIKYVFPMKGNERALGLDLMTRPAAPFVEKAIMERRTTVNDPTVTVQGSLSIVPRAPLFRGDQFLGLAQGVLDVSRMMEEVSNAGDHRFAIQLRDGNGNVFWGPKRFISDTRTLSIPVGDNAWTMTVGWKALPPGPIPLVLALIWGAGGALLLSLLFIVERTLTQTERLRSAVSNRTAALRESEARLAEEQRRTQELIEVLPNPIYFKNTDGRYLGVNKAWEEYFGRSRDAFIGRTVHDLYPNDAKTRDLLYAKDQELWQCPGSQTVETTITAPDGTLRETIYYKATYSNADGSVAGLVGTIVDITDRKRAEEDLRESEARFRCLTEMSSDFYWESDADHRLTMRGAADTRPSTVPAFQNGTQIGQRRWDIAYLSPDESGWAAHRAVLDAHQPFRHFELSRLGADGHERHISISGDPVFDATGAFAGYRGVGTDITERKQYEENLRASEARYRSVANSANVAIVSGNAAGIVVGWNPAAEHVFGYPETEIIGQTLTLLMPRRFQEQHLEGMRRLRFGGEKRVIGKVVELTGVRKDGSEFPVELSMSEWMDGKEQFFTAIISDITERHQAEAKIRRQTQLYATLSKCNAAIVRCTSAEELFAQICRDAVQSGGMKSVRISLVDRAAGKVRVAASFGAGSENLQELEISLDANNPFGRGPTGIAIREDRAYWCDDFLNDPATAPWHERGARLGWGSVAALPLRQSGVVVGALIVFYGEANSFDADVRQLLKEMAVDISFALENFEREAMRQRAQKDLLAAEEQFRGLVEQAIAGIFIIQDGKLAYVNPRAAEIVGHSAVEELFGTDPLICIAEVDRGKVTETLRRLFEGEVKSAALEFGVVHQDGFTIQAGANAVRATHQGRPAVIGMLQDISEKKRSEEQIERYVKQLQVAFMSTVEVATTLSEMRDPYTAGHERRVGKIAEAIGAELGLDEHRIEGLRVAGFLHDIGKITIPAEILSKPGKLSLIEYQLIKGHPQSSFDVLKSVEFPWPVAQVALQHHERMDGSGYPQGLKGEAILLEARIMAVADVVEAMSSHRPYRASLGINKALAEIERGRGSAYDTAVADACLRMYGEKHYQLPE